MDNPNVIIVDDDPIILEMAEDFLTDNGFRVLSFEDSTKAKSYIDAKAHSVEFCILDYFIPKLNGFDLYKIIRNKFQNIPIAIVSGHDVEDILPKTHCDSNLYVLPKPFSLTKLVDFMKQKIKENN